MTKDEAMKLALEALEFCAGTSYATDANEVASKAITALRQAIEQAERAHLKPMPRNATKEMLKAMDECSTEGYDERLYAGHASSVYTAAWDAFQAIEQAEPEQLAKLGWQEIDCPICGGGARAFPKPEQEPVAQIRVSKTGDVMACAKTGDFYKLPDKTLLYTSPPQGIPQAIPQIPQEHSSNESAYQRGYLDGMAKRPAPLSDWQIAKILDSELMSFNKSPPTHEFAPIFARAIEAAHGIKGEV